MTDNLPPFLGDDFWLRPEGAEAIEQLNEEQRGEYLAECQETLKLFGGRRGQRWLDRMRQRIDNLTPFQPGASIDQATVLAVGSSAQRDMLAFIENEMKLAREA